ncbi:hypothetical protein RHODGE_RHODGE_03528 [Rhodoplanes serenus]|uniref:Uncharacterized protein n=1 Tax=Rhodoplanes serenus TaxID=200615 RepID=A0A447CYJ4_9BRAD|nr:hypothetical protein RHODGE_RHODGE_03528 [Rhodoplanes serenus]
MDDTPLIDRRSAGPNRQWTPLGLPAVVITDFGRDFMSTSFAAARAAMPPDETPLRSANHRGRMT